MTPVMEREDPVTEDSERTDDEPAVGEHHDPTHADMAAISRLTRRFGSGLHRWQAWVHKRPWLRLVYRVLLAVVATLVIIAGIAMLVLPGPGWLTIFLGLAILGSEFHWARRLLGWLRMQVAGWWHRYTAWRAERRAFKQQRAEERAARAQALRVAEFERDLGD
jgi:uncharacterized protein (TIGR02611 family)